MHDAFRNLLLLDASVECKFRTNFDACGGGGPPPFGSDRERSRMVGVEVEPAGKLINLLADTVFA